MRILIVGAGALGGYFGARLLAAGRDVTFLVRPRTAALLAANGLVVTSPLGDLTLPPPRTVLAQNLNTPYDLILLSCKAHDLEDAMTSFAPAVGPDSSILPLLNGMAHMDALDARFGRAHVLGGATIISAVRSPEGQIRHLNRLHALHFGDRDDPSGPRIRVIADALAAPGIESLLSPNILQDMANKWISIATAAGITCLMRAPIGNIVAAGGTPLIQQLLQESTAITSALGYPPTPEYLQTILAKWTEPGSPFKSSMLHDIESGNPIEAHPIIGDLLTQAARHAVPLAILPIIHTHLLCYEATLTPSIAPTSG